MDGSLFDVVLDAVKKSALIDNEDREVLEKLCKCSYVISYLGKLAISRALVDRRFGIC